MRCGNDIKLRRYWLDVDFPIAPPPEFERSGIEITDNFISWTTMPVDSLTVARLNAVLWPSAVTQASWSFSKVLLKQNFDNFCAAIGVQTKAQLEAQQKLVALKAQVDSLQANMEALTAQRDSLIAKRNATRSQKPDSKSNDDLPSGTSQSNQVPELPVEPGSSGHGGSMDKTSDSQTKGLVAASNRVKIDRPAPGNNQPSLAPHSQILHAVMAFSSKLAQTWKPAKSMPPRGSLIVSGFVEIDSPKAWIVVDVIAAWDPKTRQYDSESMRVHFRRLQMKKQAPLGGR
jgi:hypothetical protein